MTEKQILTANFHAAEDRIWCLFIALSEWGRSRPATTAHVVGLIIRFGIRCCWFFIINVAGVFILFAGKLNWICRWVFMRVYERFIFLFFWFWMLLLYKVCMYVLNMCAVCGRFDTRWTRARWWYESTNTSQFAVERHTTDFVQVFSTMMSLVTTIHTDTHSPRDTLTTQTRNAQTNQKKKFTRVTLQNCKNRICCGCLFSLALSLSSFFRGITEFTRLEFSVDGDVDRDSLSSSHMQSKGKQFAVSFIVRWQKARNNKLIPGMNCTLVLLITGILNARIWNVIERFLWPEWFLILLGRPERRNEKIVDIWLFSHTGRRLWLASISTLYAPPNNV